MSIRRVHILLSGTGRFRPKEGATPYLGKVGQVSKVAEEKVEVVFPAKIKAKSFAGNASCSSL